jgi:hypothetical protein
LYEEVDNFGAADMGLMLAGVYSLTVLSDMTVR